MPALGVATISALVNLGNTLYAALPHKGVWQISLVALIIAGINIMRRFILNVSALLV